jgi:hypothetical protein
MAIVQLEELGKLKKKNPPHRDSNPQPNTEIYNAEINATIINLCFLSRIKMHILCESKKSFRFIS